MGKVRAPPPSQPSSQKKKQAKRELTPPSSSASDDDDQYRSDSGSDFSMEEEGTQIPALDIALLSHLQSMEQQQLRSDVDALYFSRAFQYFREFEDEQNRFVLEKVQPLVVKLLEDAAPLRDEILKDTAAPPQQQQQQSGSKRTAVSEEEEEEEELRKMLRRVAQRASFYSSAFASVHDKASASVQTITKRRMQLASYAMMAAQADEGEGSPEQWKRWFDMEDLLHYVSQCQEDAEELWSHVTAVTARHILSDDCGVETVKGAPRCLAVEYTFHLLPEEAPVAARRAFKNSTLKLVFVYAGATMDRGATLQRGRLVTVLAEPVQWRSDAAKERVLDSPNYGIFYLFFSGFMPEYHPTVHERDGKSVTGPSADQWKIAQGIAVTLQRVLGATVGVPASTLTTVDVEVFQRALASYFGANAAVGSPTKKQPRSLPTPVFGEGTANLSRKRRREEEEEESDEEDDTEPTVEELKAENRAITEKIFACVQSILRVAKTIPASTSSSTSLPLTVAELDLARRVILFHDAFNHTAAGQLLTIASGPVELALNDVNRDTMEDDEEGEEFEEDDDEEYEEEESDDDDEEEEEPPKKQPKPPVVVTKQSMKGQPAPPKPGQQDCKQQ